MFGAIFTKLSGGGYPYLPHGYFHNFNMCAKKGSNVWSIIYPFGDLASWRKIITLVPPKAESYVAQLRQAAKQKTHRVIYVAFACCHAKGS